MTTDIMTTDTTTETNGPQGILIANSFLLELLIINDIIIITRFLKLFEMYYTEHIQLISQSQVSCQ